MEGEYDIVTSGMYERPRLGAKPVRVDWREGPPGMAGSGNSDWQVILQESLPFLNGDG